MSEASTQQTGLRKQRVGIVISTKMDKTIVVEYIARVPHPKFKKIVKKSKKFYAHDEKSEAAVGDKVRIELDIVIYAVKPQYPASHKCSTL